MWPNRNPRRNFEGRIELYWQFVHLLLTPDAPICAISFLVGNFFPFFFSGRWRIKVSSTAILDGFNFIFFKFI